MAYCYHVLPFMYPGHWKWISFNFWLPHCYLALEPNWTLATQNTPCPVTEQEMIFGILGNSLTITLRNWLTYCLQFCISQQEVLAYHNKKGLLNEFGIKLIYNSRVHRLAVQRLLGYEHCGRLDLFHKYYTINEAFVTKQFQIVPIFPV